jgi:ABC-type glycerol-3-phosphate transport system permease component
MGSQVPPAPLVRTSPAPSGSAPLPPSRAQQAAKASWLAPLIVIIFNFVIKSSLPTSQARSLVIAVVSLLFYLGGLVLAIYALSQVRSAGRKGVLAPAIAGLILNGLFLILVGLVAVSNFSGARAKAAPPQSLLRHGSTFICPVA